MGSYALLSSPEETSITLASTTSTENSGLLGYLLPIFKGESGIRVRVVAVGTGQAMRMAMKGDADVILVHHRPSEEEFVNEGYGVERIDVMHNDFVIVGPASDPAGIKGMTDTATALGRVRSSRAAFVSRGDDSGTHKRELSLWAALGLQPGDDDLDWYRESGSGQGATLNVASEMDAYCLSDRASWVTFANKRSLELLVEGDPKLLNPYSVILVNPEKYPHIRAAEGQQFIDWLVSERGQQLIAAFRLEGQQLFFPDALQANGE
ncbi:MAG: substrate-binding domain-containing protein [Acidobacteria bacterium]|nr:substrate-binding domain-containing protein [Candidatus Sulfomarinibacter kjeldsenii]